MTRRQALAGGIRSRSGWTAWHAAFADAAYVHSPRWKAAEPSG